MVSVLLYAYNLLTPYTPRRNERCKEIKFNTEISDPYRWMEDPDSYQTVSYVHEMNNIADRYLKECPHIRQFETRYRELYNYEKYGCPFKRGHRYYYFYNTGMQNQSILYTQEDLCSESEVFLDPNTFSLDGTVSLRAIGFTKDGQKVAYSISESGSDWNTIKIMDVNTKAMYQEKLTKIKFSGIQWTHDHCGFFYSMFPDAQTDSGTSNQANKFMKLYYHKINTPQSDDILCVDFPDNERWLLGAELTNDGRYLLIYIHVGTDPKNRLFYVDLSTLPNGEIAGRLPYVKLIDNFDAKYSYICNDNTQFTFHTTFNAPMGKIIRIDLNNPHPDNWKTVIPEARDLLDDVTIVAQTKLVINYLHDAKSVLYIYELETGDYIKEIELPEAVSIDGITGRREDDVMFFKFSSFLTPGIIYSCDMTNHTPTPAPFKEQKATGFDSSLFVAHQVKYKSYDGTIIPMFLVHRKDIELDGSHPLILYGYGGFDISFTPYFSPSRIAWIQNMKGVYALPNLRGGGEYGEKWHQMGMYEKKQNVFNDFITAAEFLIDNGYTNKDKICISGGSNGGLLVAACANQRPDLFKCIYCAVGVLDMLRFHKFTIGHAWVAEYGDPDVAEHFEYIYKYSPLHNIPQLLTGDNEVQYPAVLLTTADHDDRVSPLHTLKFSAELRHRFAKNPKQTNPLILRVDTKSGHGFGKPTEKIIEEQSEVFGFIGKVLQVDWQS